MGGHPVTTGQMGPAFGHSFLSRESDTQAYLGRQDEPENGMNRDVQSFKTRDGHATGSRSGKPRTTLLWSFWILAAGLASPHARRVDVSTVDALVKAVADAASGDTLLLRPGTYALPGPLQIDGKKKVTLASSSGNARETAPP